MARPALDDVPADTSYANGFLTPLDRWTAEKALELLPETNGPRIEVYGGSVIVSPHEGVDHQIIAAELIIRLRPAARQAGLWAYPEVNIIGGDDLYIPDLSVLRTSGAGRASLDIADAVLLVEIVSDGNRRKDAIDRPKVYAAAKVPWYMRVELRRRVPAVALYELVDGAYQPAVACAAGSVFAMTEPFAFTVDPGELLAD
jgi:Uma2 family endonuclease